VKKSGMIGPTIVADVSFHILLLYIIVHVHVCPLLDKVLSLNTTRLS